MPINPPAPRGGATICLDGSAVVVGSGSDAYHVDLRAGCPTRGELYRGHPAGGHLTPDPDWLLRSGILSALASYAGAFPASDTGRYIYPRLRQLWDKVRPTTES